MPRAAGAKTKSGPDGSDERSPGFFQRAGFRLRPAGGPGRRRIILYVVGVILAVFAVLAPTLFYQPPTAQLRVGSRTVSLEIASTDATRSQGLSGRSSLAPNKGMLFVFDTAARQCFWMKGMRFPLDMVFVSHTKQVVQIQPDISPRTYPKNFCAASTQYVIELNAGRAEALGIHTGQTLNF